MRRTTTLAGARFASRAAEYDALAMRARIPGGGVHASGVPCKYSCHVAQDLNN